MSADAAAAAVVGVGEEVSRDARTSHARKNRDLDDDDDGGGDGGGDGDVGDARRASRRASRRSGLSGIFRNSAGCSEPEMEDDGHAAAAAAATAAFHGLDLEEDGEEDVLTPPETVMRKATEEFARTGTFPGVTPRFLRCAKGDGVEAKARWEETLQWRADEKINELLTTPQPFYDPIKTHYPHFLHFRSTNGCQVYYERVGHINLKGLHANGVTLDNLLSFYTFEAEFLYTYLLPDDDSQTITVIDCSGLTLRKLPGEAMRFIRTANSIMGRHYPERAFRVYIINAPIYFTVLWRAISVIIDPATLEKIHVTHGKNASLKALKEFIAPENIPKMYGGSCEVPFGESPEEVKLKDLVARLGQGTEQDPQ